MAVRLRGLFLLILLAGGGAFPAGRAGRRDAHGRTGGGGTHLISGRRGAEYGDFSVCLRGNPGAAPRASCGGIAYIYNNV